MEHFWLGFEKVAKGKEDRDEKDFWTAAGSTGAGVYGVHKAKPLITGRTTLYHGTHRDAAAKIVNEGLKPGAPGIADMLDEKLKAGKYVYMTPSKAEAHAYANQAEAIKEKLKANPKMSRREAAQEYVANVAKRYQDANGPLKGKILKGSVPLWQYKVHENPELLGAKSGTHYHQLFNKGKAVKAPWFATQMAYHGLKRPTMDSVHAKHFVKSKHYERLGKDELKRYIKHAPKRFASGLAVGAAGLGAIGYGAHRAKQLIDRKIGKSND